MILTDLLTSVGRLHPLVVHLPIGILILAFLFDLLSYRSATDFKPATRLMLLAGFVTAVLACTLGYLLSLTTDYDLETLSRHQYSGIVLAIVSGALYWMIDRNHVSKKVFTILFAVTIGLVCYTGYEGGTLTHGSEYLSFGSVEKIRKKPIVSDTTEVIVTKVNPEIPDSMDLSVVQRLREKGVTIRIMLQKPVMLDVTIMPEPHINIASVVEELKIAAPNIIWFNAAGNNLGDDDAGFLRTFVNLEKLRLEKNPLSDTVIDNLMNLKYLVAVNLYKTKVTKAGVVKLKRNPAIKRIYVWGTKAEQL